MNRNLEKGEREDRGRVPFHSIASVFGDYKETAPRTEMTTLWRPLQEPRKEETLKGF